MEEIGTWLTAEGTTPARVQLEADVTATEMPSWASGLLQGAAGGAATGAVAGPYGALIGAVAGGAIGAAGALSQPQPQPQARPAASPAAPTAPAARPAGAPSPTSAASGGSNRAQIIVALQQFAAVIPALVQVVAATGGGRETVGTEASWGSESLDAEAWGPEAFQGTWSVT
jgi:hypothetical protein